MGNAKTPASPRSLKRLVLPDVEPDALDITDTMRLDWMLDGGRVFKNGCGWLAIECPHCGHGGSERTAIDDAICAQLCEERASRRENDKLTDEPASVTKQPKGN